MITKYEKELTKKLNNLYKSIYDEKHKATQEELQEANKIVFLFNCGRLNVLQACYRLTLIYNHLVNLIYTEENNNVCLELLK